MFNYDGDNQDIIDAVVAANDKELIRSVVFQIGRRNSFDMCDMPPMLLAQKFLFFFNSTIVNIEVYYPRWRFSKAIGYYTKSKPLTIHINGYKKLELMKRVCNLYHEKGHVFDFFEKDYTINHGDNNPRGKQKTFQYSLNRFVEMVFNPNNTDNSKIEFYLPWYKRLFNFIFRR